MVDPAKNNRTLVLNEARTLLQTRGINAFSHRDLADAVGIKSSSVHYYFPTKESLGVALMQSYRDALRDFFDQVSQLNSADARLEQFFALFEQTARTGDRICMAGMLASDFATLGEDLKTEVLAFFTMVESWLALQAGLIRPERSAARNAVLAQLAFSLLEGALLTGRVFADPGRVQQAARLIHDLFEQRSL